MPQLPAGIFTAKSTEHQWCYSSKGTKCIAVRFEIIDADAESNQAITWYGYFSDKTWERTLESLRYMGWDGKDLTDLGSLNEPVSLDITNEEYQGRTHSKVAWVNLNNSQQR